MFIWTPTKRACFVGVYTYIMREYRGKITLIDRFAVGLMCALVTFITSLLLLVAIHWIFFRVGTIDFLDLTDTVIIITLLSALLGFFDKEKYLSRCLLALSDNEINRT